jgi:hypothetical protein
MRVRSILTALGLNAIPAAGWFFAEWSAATTLVVYWLETLIGSLLVGLRILLHRRVRPSQGHWIYEAPKSHEHKPQASHRSSSYLTAFLVPALVFTLAHGVFLAAFGAIVFSKSLSPETKIDGRSVLAGLIGILIFQAIDFVADLIWLRTRPFRWIERLGEINLGRVIVIQLTIIGGMAAVIFTGADRNFFGVFIFLKTMLNASLVLPQYNPATPPAWLSNLMDRIKPSKEDGTFAEFWKKTDEQEASRIVRNESPLRRA